MLAEKTEQRPAAHAPREPLRTAVATGAIRRKNRSAGFAGLQILCKHRRGGAGQEPRAGQETSNDLDQGRLQQTFSPPGLPAGWRDDETRNLAA
jgi:hypothetical protein